MTSNDHEQWLRDGVSHIDLGEWYLRQAIKHTVANDGHASILEHLLWRKALAAILSRNSQHGVGYLGASAVGVRVLG